MIKTIITESVMVDSYDDRVGLCRIAFDEVKRVISNDFPDNTKRVTLSVSIEEIEK